MAWLRSTFAALWTHPAEASREPAGLEPYGDTLSRPAGAPRPRNRAAAAKPTRPAPLLVWVLVVLGLTLAGCSDEPEQRVAGVSSTVGAALALSPGDGFVAQAPLRGEEVVPPVRTEATGLFRVTGTVGGDADFELGLEGLQGVIAVRLRSGVPGTDGPLLATLFSRERDGPTPPTSGRFADEQLAGSKLQGEGVRALVALLLTGEAYVEVETEAYPEGELRGQLMPMPGGSPAREAAGEAVSAPSGGEDGGAAGGGAPSAGDSKAKGKKADDSDENGSKPPKSKGNGSENGKAKGKGG